MFKGNGNLLIAGLLVTSVIGVAFVGLNTQQKVSTENLANLPALQSRVTAIEKSIDALRSDVEKVSDSHIAGDSLLQEQIDRRLDRELQAQIDRRFDRLRNDLDQLNKEIDSIGRDHDH